MHLNLAADAASCLTQTNSTIKAAPFLLLLVIRVDGSNSGIGARHKVEEINNNGLLGGPSLPFPSWEMW